MSFNSAMVCYPAVMISPTKIRDARSLPGWRLAETAAVSDVLEISIKKFERGSTLGKIESTIAAARAESAGPGQASTSGGRGVRLKGGH